MKTLKYLLFMAFAYTLTALADQNDGKYMRPIEPTASHYYTEAKAMADAGQPDAKLFLATIALGWDSAHPNLPIEPYGACMLYQFSGIGPFVDLHYANFVKVLAGDPTAADGGEQAAHDLVQHMTPTQKKLAERLKFFMKKYAVTCDAELTGHLSPDDMGPVI